MEITPAVMGRFLAKVKKTRGCWWWIGALDEDRGKFGIVRDDGSRYIEYASRVSYQLFKGPIPLGQLIRHTCDNRRCVNPSHLIAGTQQDNINDCIDRERNSFGIRNGQARLTDSDVKKIRHLRAMGITCRKIAKRFGIHHTQVSRCDRRLTWSHVS